MRRRAVVAIALVTAGCAADVELADYNDLLRLQGRPAVTRAQYDDRLEQSRRAQEARLDEEARDRRFEPASTILARGDEVRRASISAFLPGPFPAVELLRHADGSVVVRANAGPDLAREAPATAQDWNGAVARDAQAFAMPPPPLRHRRGEPLPPTPPVCHGASAFLEAAGPGYAHRRTAGAGCGDGEGSERLAFAAAVALYAVAADRLPECAKAAPFPQDGFYTLWHCFQRLSSTGASR